VSLDDLRATIDGIDDAILELLERRADTARAVAAEKERVGRASYYDPERERSILERLVAKSRKALPDAAIRAVYREIISACLSMQRPLRVAFLGPRGTFSEMAARGLFGDAAEYVEAATIEGVFDAVTRGDASRGVVPVENSGEGSVAATLRSLVEGELRIERETVIEVAHCLLSRASSLAKVRRVYSHPQGLGQCAAWLRKNLPDATLVQKASTAGAALEAAADPEGAAIGNRLAGEHHGLDVLASDVQDSRDNATRFLVVGPKDSPRTGDDKTTLAFGLLDRPGALRAALGAFEEEGITLSRIESQPSRDRAWSYVFVCDFGGHREDEASQRALAKLGEAAATVKVIGSYPRGGK
jgi:chorismate mutase/prephenate dehydratase